MNYRLTVVDGFSCASVDAAIDRARSLLSDAARFLERGMLFRLLNPNNLGDEYVEASRAVCRCALLELFVAETNLTNDPNDGYRQHMWTVISMLRNEIHEMNRAYTARNAVNYQLNGLSSDVYVTIPDDSNSTIKVG